MSRIVVLGSANMDLVVRQPRAPHAGETIFGRSYGTVPGGKGLNQAVAARRAGGDVTFVGAVGDDRHGEEIVALLDAEGIGTEHVRRSADPTGVALINVFDSGENSIVVVSGANSTGTLTVEEATAVRSADYLVMQFERPVELLLAAARQARHAGTLTVLTPAPVIEHDPELIKLTDVLILNEGEAAELSGVADPEAAATELSRLASSVVVTLGGEGAIVVENTDTLHRLPARDVTAVDTTAAGDTFVGALVARLASGDTLRTAAEWATAAASIAVTRAGATSSMPTADEVHAVLRD